MTEELKNKTALVTGGSRGIGRDIALRLARSGANVAVVDLLADEAEKTVADIASLGVKACFIAADVSREDAARDAVAKCMENLGTLDVLVNNAGITKDGLIMRMSQDQFNAVLQVNLVGVFNFTKAATKPMVKARYGRIVNIASVAGIFGTAGQANYAAAKAGVIALTKVTAREFGSRGITANAIAPGFINTAMTEVLQEDVKEKYKSQIPLGVFGETSDIAGAVAFLAGPEAGYITGQTLVVDGGMIM